MIKIYTDGACPGNQYDAPSGGLGVVVLEVKRTIPQDEMNVLTEISQGYRDTTNNRMELRAVIEGLSYVAGLKGEPQEIDVYSDSRYLVNAFNQGWIGTWKRKSWKKSKGKDVKNQDLWKHLLQVIHEVGPVSFHWIKGHSRSHHGDDYYYNAKADTLAVEAANSDTLIPDSRS